AAGKNQRAPLGSHLQAVDHHQCFDRDLDFTSAEPQHVWDMGPLKKKLAGEFVVFFVERSAGDENSNGFGVHKSAAMRSIAQACVAALQTTPSRLPAARANQSPRGPGKNSRMLPGNRILRLV